MRVLAKLVWILTLLPTLALAQVSGGTISGGLTGLPPISSPSVLGNSSGSLASPVALTVIPAGVTMDASGITGGPLPATAYPNSPLRSSTTNLTVAASDLGGVIFQTQTAPCAVSIPAVGSAGFTASNYQVGIFNLGTAPCIVTPAGGATINSVATYTIPPSQGTEILADSTGGAGNYRTAPLGTTRAAGGISTICVVNNAAPATHTGDTAEFNLGICTVPIGTLGTNSMLRITPLWSRTAATTDTVTYNIRLSATSGDIATGLLAMTYAQATSGVTFTQNVAFIRNTSSTSQQALANTLSAYTASSGAATSPTSAFNNTTTVLFLNFNCLDAVGTDTCGLYGYTVELITP